MRTSWKPRAPALASHEALHRAIAYLLLPFKENPDSLDHQLAAELGEWGRAEVTFRCRPGTLASWANRAAIAYELAGTVAATDALHPFDGRALVDQQTLALLDLALSVGPPIRSDHP